MAAEENKTLVRRYLEEAWSRGDVDLARELLAPNYTLRPLQRTTGEGSRQLGHARVEQDIAMYHKAFADLQITPDLLLAEGDMVAAEWTARATHTGELRGMPPTGKQVTYAGITIYRIENGKIAEERYFGDRLGLWQQLGVIPSTPHLVEEVAE